MLETGAQEEASEKIATETALLQARSTGRSYAQGD